MSVRVRFAPSPTGFLHVGGARTALFNYLFARKHKGSFIIRIEDTDQDRHQEDSIYPLLSAMKWLGLDWDEGPFIHNTELKIKGNFAPYRQKDRLSIYKEKAEQLISEDKAYYCFMSVEEEEERKAKALKKGFVWKAESPYRDLDLKTAQNKIQKGEQACIRFKMPIRSKNYIIKDIVRNEVCFPPDVLGDFIIVRADGFPVYNFSCAIDDSLMKITHVLRGEEHLSNTLKQQLIQKALNFGVPETAHLSIILGDDKKKLSKRSGSESLEYYKEEGYLPSAVMNFLALLGWNPKTDKEIFSKEELIESFDIKGLNPSSAIFDKDKLLWLNSEHIKSLSNNDLLEKIKYFTKSNKTKENISTELISSLRSNFKTLKSAVETLDFFLDENFSIQKSANEVLSWPQSYLLIEKWTHFLQNFLKDNLQMEDFKMFQKQIQKEIGLKGKEFFMPLRCALMGQAEGMEIKLLITLLNKKQLLFRAEKTLYHIKNHSK